MELEEQCKLLEIKKTSYNQLKDDIEILENLITKIYEPNILHNMKTKENKINLILETIRQLRYENNNLKTIQDVDIK